MPTETAAIIAVLFLIAATLYSSVGHAGASGYLAVMGLMGVATPMMKPTALILNILVATIGTFQFLRAGCFSWRLFWPFALGSVPAAYAGGAMKLPTTFYKVGVGAILLFSAIRMFVAASKPDRSTVNRPPIPAALLAGAAIGMLSGLTGTGGGIFLSPLLLFAGWAETRETSGVSAAFILVNSVAGLSGLLPAQSVLPSALPIWAAAALLGGAVGANFGSRRITTPWLRRLLGMVLVVAGLKLIFVR